MRKPTYTVYCWDGFQRGHAGDFVRLKQAEKAAEAACENCGHGEEVFVIHNRSQQQVALYLPDCGGKVAIQNI
jgi:hypothetical protein